MDQSREYKLQTTKHHIQKERRATTMCKIVYLFLFLIVVCLVPWSSGEAATQQQFTLTVTKAGGGSGKVTSSPSGINCGSVCSGTFKQGKKVTLTAKADSGSLFTGWGGSCSGTGSCSVVMNSDVTVTATFETKPNTKVPEISVSPDSLDFGVVEIGKKVTKTLAISNVGTGDLQITISGLEDSDLSISGKSIFTVKPQKSYNLKVTCKPTEEGSDTDLDAGDALSLVAEEEADEELDISEALTEEEKDEELGTGPHMKIINIGSNDTKKPTVSVPVTWGTPAGCPPDSSKYSLIVNNQEHGTVLILTQDTVELGSIDFTIQKHQKAPNKYTYVIDCSGGSTDPENWFCEATTTTTGTFSADAPECTCLVTCGVKTTWQVTGTLNDSCSVITLTLVATKVDFSGWSGLCCGVDPNNWHMSPFIGQVGLERNISPLAFVPNYFWTKDCSSPPFTCTLDYTLVFNDPLN